MLFFHTLSTYHVSLAVAVVWPLLLMKRPRTLAVVHHPDLLPSVNPRLVWTIPIYFWGLQSTLAAYHFVQACSCPPDVVLGAIARDLILVGIVGLAMILILPSVLAVVLRLPGQSRQGAWPRVTGSGTVTIIAIFGIWYGLLRVLAS